MVCRGVCLGVGLGLRVCATGLSFCGALRSFEELYGAFYSSCGGFVDALRVSYLAMACTVASGGGGGGRETQAYEAMVKSLYSRLLHSDRLLFLQLFRCQ